MGEGDGEEPEDRRGVGDGFVVGIFLAAGAGEESVVRVVEDLVSMPKRRYRITEKLIMTMISQTHHLENNGFLLLLGFL